ncbi:SpoIIE family protein phosphatase [Kitasatospora sp. NPDC050543]|uniref:SpoIIE family protein phosphatase n=1 Tax=Kitasatospora sp. NPDC050543 TaxID=3364054 RepID=UPI00379FD861
MARAAGPAGEQRDDQSAGILDALFTQAPQGLFVFDGDLRIVRFNTAARGIRGVAADKVVGHRLSDFAPGFDTAALDSLAASVLETGTEVRNLVVHGTAPADPGRRISLVISIFRVQDADGSVLGIASAQDVTKGQQAVERLRILTAAHRLIGTTLDAFRTATELCDTAVPRFTDAVTVDILDAALRGVPLEPGPVGLGAPLRRAAFRSLTSGVSGADADEQGALRTFPFPTPFTQSLGDAAPRLVRSLDPDETWLATDPVRARRLLDMGVHSMIIMPLSVHGTLLGVAGFYRYRRIEPFDDDDLELARELAARTSLSIDNALSYARERTIATALQRHLLPQEPPPLTAVETAHLYLAGSAGGGGHWYDVIPLSSARVALTVGDVVGSGIEAAATMGQLRTALRTLASRDLPPEELLAGLDETAGTLNAEQDREPGGGPGIALRPLATCFYAVYDPLTRVFTAARAGHPPPVLVGPDGSALAFDPPQGAALGTGEGGYEAATLELPEGSLLALHTSSLTAGAGPVSHPDGPGGPGGPSSADPADVLCRVLAHPGQDLKQMCDDAVYALLPGRTSHDAILLLARTRALGEDRVAIWTLPDDLAVVRTARRLAEHQLGVWDLPDLAYPTELIVSELVTNAIRYGSPPILLRMILDRSLICEVSDSSSTAPHLRRARPTDEGGRGLFIIGQLGQRWGTRFGARGKTIWSEQALPGGAQHPAA